MLDLNLLRIASLIAIAFIYLLFDVFNKRNVPSIFAYATVAYGFLLTLTYLNIPLIATSLGIAAAIAALGYLAYRAGQLGAADFLEFAALSMIIPLQPVPYLLGAPPQFGLPFIISLLVNTGIIALVFVPIFYLSKAARKGLPWKKLKTGEVAKAITLLFAYAAFALFLLAVGAGAAGIALVAVLGAFSTVLLLTSGRITTAMASYLPPSRLQPEDMLALNLLEDSDIRRIRKRIKSFQRLVTPRMLKELREKRFREKLPVYTDALPLALPIFAAVLLALLLGNLMLLILPL